MAARRPLPERRVLLVRGAIVAAGLIAGAVVLATLPTWRREVREGWEGRRAHEERILDALVQALAAYREDQGAYPACEDEATALVRYLDGDLANGGPEKRYFEFPGQNRAGDAFLDNWRNPYRYRRVGEGFEVWSTAGGKTRDDAIRRTHK